MSRLRSGTWLRRVVLVSVKIEEEAVVVVALIRRVGQQVGPVGILEVEVLVSVAEVEAGMAVGFSVVDEEGMVDEVG